MSHLPRLLLTLIFLILSKEDTVLGVAWQLEARAREESPGFWVSWWPGLWDSWKECWRNGQAASRATRRTEVSQQLESMAS